MLVMGMLAWRYGTLRKASAILGLLLHMAQALQLKTIMNENLCNGMSQHWTHRCQRDSAAIDVFLFAIQLFSILKRLF